LKTERIIGFLVFFGVLISAIYLFYPNEYDSSKNSLNLDDKETSDVNKNDIANGISIEEDKTAKNIPKNTQFKRFEESDFDFFVYRAHVLSSKEKAYELRDKINNGGLTAFVEPFGDNQKLFVIYVGPFQTEDDIVNNMKLIQELSESNKGEISRWKL
jgi:cell division septation protein DedD